MNNSLNVYDKKIKQQILENSLSDKTTHLIGSYKGFNTSVKLLTSEQYINVRISAANMNDLNNEQLKSWINTNFGQFKEVVKINTTSARIELIIKRPFNGKAVPDLVNYNVELVINYLISNGYSTCCEACGKNHQSAACYKVNDQYAYLCNDCVVKLEEGFNRNKAQRSNVEIDWVKGIIGAIGGALIGLIIWVIIYKLGFIASLAGFAIAYGALLGFEKLGKNLNKKSVIACIIVMIITVWLANKVSWALEAYNALEVYSFGECFSNLSAILEASDLTANYFGDLFIGYVLTVVGSFRIVLQAWRQGSGYYKIEKVENK